jgi:tetratricopeptide (TPR) repeat protein
VEPSSVDDVCQRLLLWGNREGGGLARVEYSSEFDRQRVVQRLRGELEQTGIVWTDIQLELHPPCEATEVVEFLLKQLSEVSEGVVSVTGFATAFETGTSLTDSLRVVNFNREALIALPLRQLWWMTPVLLQTSLHAMPDLHGWFRPHLQLSPQIINKGGDSSTLFDRGVEQNRGVNFEDARQRSHNLLTQFNAARQAGAADQDLLMTYLLPALESLAEVGAQLQLQDLTLQFEGLLGEIKEIDRPEMVTSLGRLGNLYKAQGRYAEAEPLLLKALKLSKQKQTNTAFSLNNLATLYESQGRYPEAEPLYLQALEIKKNELGDRHPSTATSLNNLAALYRSQGRYPEAEPLYIQALEIHKTELGDRHPSTATSLNNLAALYKSQGRYPEAEPLYIQALEIKKTELGDRHPSTATSLNNLAELYRSQGRYPEAEPLYIQALEIKKTELGDRHPDTAQSLNNLAALYESQSRYPEAEPLYIQALEISKTELGDRHPFTATSLNNLAVLYCYMKQFEQALPLLEQALDIWHEVLPPGHPDILSTQESLENLRQVMGAKSTGNS